MKKEIDLTEVRRICAEHQIEIQDLKSITGSFDKRIFPINQALLLRVSETPMTLEQEKFRRVATPDFVPKIVHFGCLYPPKPDIDLRVFLRALFEASPRCTQFPDLAQRLTLYQIEHEIQQIIWQGSEGPNPEGSPSCPLDRARASGQSARSWQKSPLASDICAVYTLPTSAGASWRKAIL